MNSTFFFQGECHVQTTVKHFFIILSWGGGGGGVGVRMTLYLLSGGGGVNCDKYHIFYT